MVVFPNFTQFYGDWANQLKAKGVKIRLSTEVTEVIERSKKGVKVSIKPRTPVPDGHNPNDDPKEEAIPTHVEEYDEIVLCTLADTSLRLLGKTAGWMDRNVLGSAKFSDDVTVTHWDSACEFLVLAFL